MLPDLIIMDVSMPSMNGLEATRVLRESIPSTPIIMFSNYSDGFVKKLALSLGAAAVVSKSQNISLLLKTARGLIVPRADLRHTSLNYWHPGSLKLPMRVCQPAALEAWPAAV
jgi:DNA-binding NarL/FixJ family response regulator